MLLNHKGNACQCWINCLLDFKASVIDNIHFNALKTWVERCLCFYCSSGWNTEVRLFKHPTNVTREILFCVLAGVSTLDVVFQFLRKKKNLVSLFLNLLHRPLRMHYKFSGFYLKYFLLLCLSSAQLLNTRKMIYLTCFLNPL